MSVPMARLLGVMRRLRAPEGGCEWDRAQTMESIVPHTLEEAYELADAVATGDTRAIRDELGDLLFQVVFLARIGEEQGVFDLDDVATAISDKLERRHPHVFGEPTALSPAAQNSAWERLKADERSAAGERGTLAGVAAALPALTRATKLSKRAARVGFDWPDVADVRAKVTEELGEFESALRDGEPRARQEEELGDLLFAIANWARHLGLDAEAALRAGNAKFEARFARMEAQAQALGLALETLDIEAWEALWARAKAGG
jgi:ATP diphosphatase